MPFDGTGFGEERSLGAEAATQVVSDRLLLRCSLAQAEAVQLHRVRMDSVQAWAEGRSKVPAAVVAELRTLHRRIERATETSARRLARVEPRPVVVLRASTPATAAAAGAKKGGAASEGKQ